LSAELKEAFPEVEVNLIKSAGGAFEVTVDGRLMFSKLRLGRHADPGEVVGLIESGRTGE
jgi:selenoprotein W-related protein